jgi:EamA domain-containing membrane protein RarD
MQVAVVALQRIVVRYPVPITIGVCAVTLAALQSGGGKWVQLALAAVAFLGYSSWRKTVSRAALASTPKYVSCIVHSSELLYIAQICRLSPSAPLDQASGLHGVV